MQPLMLQTLIFDNLSVRVYYEIDPADSAVLIESVHAVISGFVEVIGLGGIEVRRAGHLPPGKTTDALLDLLKEECAEHYENKCKEESDERNSNE